ncbi:Mobile element protein [hydrothermal vent metagenome]|uniref:Mobile element protein n=1 Tax=hydrothermal vent metagenome TaxID=652676 RepID=A0A1W1C8Z7_9ZZZZ
MHREEPYTVTALCALFNKTKQAYYQRLSYEYEEQVKSSFLYDAVIKHRKIMPRIGGRKLHYLINKELPSRLQIGRDKFFDWLRANNLLVRRRRTRIFTTNSHHWLHKHPYLLEDYEPTCSNQLWVSDITYIKTLEGEMYLFLITDAWSKKILGWALSDNLRAENALVALKMALKQRETGTSRLIHHSDRGVQYCSEKYVKLLEKNGIDISMTQNSNPLDNSIAERINGILKDEWIYQKVLETKVKAHQYIRSIINIYNNKRPHLSLGMLTPEVVHQMSYPLLQKQRLWKNYYGKPVGGVPAEI